MRYVLTLTTCFALAACGGTDVQFPTDAGSTDVTATADTHTPPTGVDPLDEDGDGYKKSVDCNDWPASGSDPGGTKIHPGATELNNGVDDNCDGKIDEGFTTTPTPTPLADSDGDGYPDGPQDCAPNDKNVHPGHAEVCANNVDDDCDGVKDEAQCTPTSGGTTTPPPTPNGDSLTCTFNWDKTSWTARYQIVYDASELFGWWDNASDAPVTTSTVTLTAQHVEADVCGVRLNTASGGEYLAFGHKNSSGASLNPNVGVACSYKGQTVQKSGLKAISHPSGVSFGSSAYWDLRPTDSYCPHPVN